MKIRGKECTEYTVEELKAMLRKKGLKVSGTKAELCDRLKPSRKRVASVKTKQLPKPATPSDPLFVFYASTYYQIPNSKMAKTELAKYGMEAAFLNRFSNHKQLFAHLKTTMAH